MSDLKQCTASPQSILDFWFSEPAKKLWFRSTPDFDTKILDKYYTLWQQAKNQQLIDWKRTAEGSLALVIILDQFPLNMFRGNAKSFSTEKEALKITHYAISKFFDKKLEPMQLTFLYMPLMHSENIDNQNLSVELFSKDGLENNLRFAKHHRDIIKRFGRFPHRNAILGRTSTADEIEYLNSPQAFTG